MREKLCRALNEISDHHIAEAAAAKRRPYWLGALAAAVALIILIVTVTGPMSLNVTAISEAAYPQALDYQERNALQVNTDELEDFFATSTAQLLSGTSQNRICSPVNIYMALAMLAETTNGNSRQQILDLLGATDTQALQTHANSIWKAVHQDDGHTVRLLANSLWLDDTVTYDKAVLDSLAENYYASSYQGDLSSTAATKALQKWLNEQTGNLLKKYTRQEQFSAQTVLSLASTVYFRAKWSEPFSSRNNTESTFHGTDGDTQCTFMHKQEYHTTYYWGDHFGAVALPLEGGSRMWLILPDADSSVDSVLAGSQLTQLLSNDYEYENSSYLRVNLSVPKFDVGSQTDLRSDLQDMGVTDIFDPSVSDFSAALPESSGITLGKISHAARVAIDEEGVTAAAYTLEDVCGATMPPDEVIDFVLDRPFLFVITTYDSLPLFAGVINNP